MATADVAARTAGIDPAAPRPPVGFRIHLPEAWTTADLHPASSDAWVRAYVRDRLGAAPETAGQRARARRGLGALLDGCRAQGVLVLLLLAGPAPDRQPSGQVGPDNLVAASLTLAWRRLASTDHIDVDGIAQSLAASPPAPGEPVDDRIVAVIDLPSGPAAYLHTSQLVAVPGTAGARCTTALTQLLVPVPDLPWLAVITTATTNPELADGIDAIADGVAHTLEFLDPLGVAEPRRIGIGHVTADGEWTTGADTAHRRR